MNELLGQPEFNRAIELVKKELVFRNLGTGVETIRAQILEVEPFKELLDKRYIGPYDRLADERGEPRKHGELFVIWPYGKPALSVVEDPDRRSIIVLKELMVNRRKMPLSTFLTDPDNGGMDPEAMREYVRNLDGVVPGSSENVDIQSLRDELSVSIQHDSSKAAPNSWGRVRRVQSRQ